MTNRHNQPKVRRPADEQAEVDAFRRDVPLFARAQELGLRFSDENGRLLSIEAQRAREKAERSERRVEDILAKVHAAAGIKPAAETVEREPLRLIVPQKHTYRIVDEPEKDIPRMSFSMRAKRWMPLAATLVFGALLQPGWQMVTQASLTDSARHEQVMLGGAHEEHRMPVAPKGPPYPFHLDSAVSGEVRAGELDLGDSKSAGNALIAGSLSKDADVTIDVTDATHAIRIELPHSRVELQAPGRYELNTLTPFVDYVKVVSGAARVESKNGTEYDWNVIYAGQDARMAERRLPVLGPKQK